MLDAVNLFKENEKLVRTMCVSYNYATMKDTFKKVISDVSSLEHKNVSVMKEVVEKINFNCYKDVNEKNLMEWISPVNKAG